jgi:hypothetical protein
VEEGGANILQPIKTGGNLFHMAACNNDVIILNYAIKL